LDEDLVKKIQGMVVEALSAERSLPLALEVIRLALRWADQLIEAFEALNPLPRPIVCQAGCSYCCHHTVEATPPEIVLLGQVLNQFLAPRKLEALRGKVLLVAACKAGKSREELAALQPKKPCPLLSDHRCLAYPWRPLMCRAMHSLDRESCRASLTADQVTGGDEFHLHRYIFTFSIVAGLRQGFQVLGCQTGVLELSQGLREILLNPHLGELWLRGERVFGAG
jgi:Fe-S-cluster containining protein